MATVAEILANPAKFKNKPEMIMKAAAKKFKGNAKRISSYFNKRAGIPIKLSVVNDWLAKSGYAAPKGKGRKAAARKPSKAKKGKRAKGKKV
jgi:hypothetical protein